MKFTLRKMPIGLTTDAGMTIDDAEGATLRVVRGRVWVTQEGSLDDLFLEAGMGHTFRQSGRVVVSAESAPGGAATVVFDAPLAVATPETLGQAVKRFFAWRPAPLSIAGNAYEGL